MKNVPASRTAEAPAATTQPGVGLLTQRSAHDLFPSLTVVGYLFPGERDTFTELTLTLSRPSSSGYLYLRLSIRQGSTADRMRSDRDDPHATLVRGSLEPCLPTYRS